MSNENIKWRIDPDDGERYPIPEFNDTDKSYDFDNHDFAVEQEDEIPKIKLSKAEKEADIMPCDNSSDDSEQIHRAERTKPKVSLTAVIAFATSVIMLVTVIIATSNREQIPIEDSTVISENIEEETEKDDIVVDSEVINESVDEKSTEENNLKDDLAMILSIAWDMFFRALVLCIVLFFLTIIIKIVRSIFFL